MSQRQAIAPIPSSSSLFLSSSSFSTLSPQCTFSLYDPSPVATPLSIHLIYFTNFHHFTSCSSLFALLPQSSIISPFFLLIHSISPPLTPTLTFLSLKILPPQGVLRSFYHRIPSSHTISSILHPHLPPPLTTFSLYKFHLH